jgi:hypothetical protein
MSAVAKQEIQTIEPRAVAQTDDPLISMIERAARDPSVDIDKMERLVAMQERSQARVSEQEFNDAMTKAQGDMRRVAVDSINPQTKSKYASYAALDKAMRPIYTQHGFALSFGTEAGAPPEYIRVTCHVSNCGHTRKYQVDMPADGKGAKGGDVMTKTHAVGSAMSYGQRYLLKMIFNIAIGQDDDGNAAGGEPISAEQAEAIKLLIVEVGADIKRFLKFMGAERVEDINARDYQRAVSALESKRAKP